MKRKILIIIVLISIISILVGMFIQADKTDKKREVEPETVQTPTLTYTIHEFNSIEFSDFAVSRAENTYSVFMNVVNHGESLEQITDIEIILFDSSKKVVSKVTTILPILEKDDVTQIIVSTTDDISTAVDFKVEFKNQNQN